MQYSLGDKNIDIMRSPPNALPKPHVRMDVLFRLLDKENIVQLITCLWLEYKVLLFSSHLSVLTTVAETLITLLYPFKWEHVYVPVLPLQLLEFVNAPTPFIMGVHPGTLPSRRDRLLNRCAPRLSRRCRIGPCRRWDPRPPSPAWAGQPAAVRVPS